MPVVLSRARFLVNAKRNIFLLSRQLHAGYAITADVYAHLGAAAQRDPADAMQAALE